MSKQYTHYNMGSGQRPFKSPFVNVDAQSRWHPDLLHDLKDQWPADDASADMIVFHHCWEHESDEAVAHFQHESYRVLKPGGSLIICVPDMRALAQAWLMGKMDTGLYMTNVYGAFMGDDHDRHRRGYDRNSLMLELRPCLADWRWSDVKDFDYRRIPGADIARDWWILAMEAVK